MQTVISAFDDREQAQRAVERLVERGFDRDDIHLQSGHDRATAVDSDGEGHRGFFESIRHFFADLFGNDDADDHSSRYAEAVRRGSSVVIVDVRDEAEAERARSALEELGGHFDVDERAQQWQREGWTDGASAAGASAASGSAGSGATATPTTDSAPAFESASGASGADRSMADTGERAQQEAVLPVLEEQVAVGKREVQRGGVRVIRRMTETPVRELVRLREERAVVERHPVDRAATPADFENFREGTLEMRETIEEPVVSKQARVVEEVVVGKRVDERTQTVEDVVRRAGVDVEPLGQGASDRMLDRTGGETTTSPSTDVASGESMTARENGVDAPRTAPGGSTPVDPEVAERTR